MKFSIKDFFCKCDQIRRKLIDIDKLKTASPVLSKLSSVMDNDVVKKTLYDQFVTQVNTTDSNKLVKMLTTT